MSYTFDPTIAATESLNTSLAPLYTTNLEHSFILKEKLCLDDSINLNLSLSYSLASLFFCLLAANGNSRKEHPIRDDIDKIKQRIERYKNLKSKASLQRPALSLDKEAALRIVSKELSMSIVRGRDEEREDKNSKKRTKKK